MLNEVWGVAVKLIFIVSGPSVISPMACMVLDKFEIRRGNQIDGMANIIAEYQGRKVSRIAKQETK